MVCFGGECRGGGDRKCLQRDPRPSVLAGILDTYGGLRFIVSYRGSLKYHVRHDELLIVVPGLKVHEPIAWGDTPFVVARIELQVDRWIKQRCIPNEPFAYEAVRMYGLRKQENPHSKRSLNLEQIAQT
jgi:hypothetical protein